MEAGSICGYFRFLQKVDTVSAELHKVGAGRYKICLDVYIPLQLKLCWQIIQCRVSAFVLEICLLILRMQLLGMSASATAVYLWGATWVMRACESMRGTRSQRGKAKSRTKLHFCPQQPQIMYPVKTASQQALLKIISLVPKKITRCDPCMAKSAFIAFLVLISLFLIPCVGLDDSYCPLCFSESPVCYAVVWS